MSINRAPFNLLVDDDGSNLAGTVWDKAHIKDVLLDPIDAEFLLHEPGTSAPTAAGNQAALALPTGRGDLVYYATNATLLSVLGIAAGLPGQRLTIYARGAGLVEFLHNHASGTALGKLSLFAQSGSTSLSTGGVAAFVYDGPATKWRLVHHEQGAWITPAFSAGDYTAAGAMTWTVDAGDVETCRYLLRGATLHFELALLSTTVGGTPSVTLRRLLPGGFSASHYLRGVAGVSNDGGVYSNVQLEIASPTRIDFYRNIAGSGNWAAAINALHLFGVQLAFEVL